MNRFVRILAVLPFFVPAACTSDATDEFNIPEEYLAEAESIPPYWIASTSEVNDYILNNVHKGEVELLGHSAGGRPIYAVTYGTPRSGSGTTTYSGASSINRIAAYRGPDSGKKVYMAIAAVHGFELEGIVGIVNMISVLETGKDLSGQPWPELEAMRDSLDRIVLVPITNPDGRDRVPIRMEKFRGSGPDAYLVHEYLNTGGLDHGKLIGWPACKEYNPVDFSAVEFPGSYPNDNGINIMHDDFFGTVQPETRIVLDLARRENPDILLNMHTGVSRYDYFIEVCRPCLGAYSPMHVRVWEQFYRHVHTDLTLGGFRGTDDLLKETTPKLEHTGTGAMNLTSVLSYHCGALAVTVEDGSHGYTGVYPDGSPVSHTPEKILNAELTLHQSAMRFLLQNGGVDVWEKME